MWWTINPRNCLAKNRGRPIKSNCKASLHLFGSQVWPATHSYKFRATLMKMQLFSKKKQIRENNEENKRWFWGPPVHSVEEKYYIDMPDSIHCISDVLSVVKPRSFMLKIELRYKMLNLARHSIYMRWKHLLTILTTKLEGAQNEYRFIV